MSKVLIFMHFVLFAVSCSATESKSNSSYQSKVLGDSDFVLSEANIKLIENSLNVNELKEYLRFDMPGRLPLVLQYEALQKDDEYTISCFGKTINMVKSANKEPVGAVINLISAYQDLKKTELVFKYPVEGIKLTVIYEFSEDQRTWRLVSKNIVEQ